MIIEKATKQPNLFHPDSFAPGQVFTYGGPDRTKSAEFWLTIMDVNGDVRWIDLATGEENDHLNDGKVWKLVDAKVVINGF